MNDYTVNNHIKLELQYFIFKIFIFTSFIGDIGSTVTWDGVISIASEISVLIATNNLARYETPSPRPVLSPEC